MNGAVLLAPPEQRWECPNCDLQQVTRDPRAHTRMHPCRGLAGLTAPMVAAGTKAKVEAVEREDYIGADMGRVQLHDGRPVMAVRTTRDDGDDVAVFAPTANARAKD